VDKPKFDLISSESGAKVDFWAGRILTFIFGIPFAASGLFVIWQMQGKFQQGKVWEALPGCVFGLVFVTVGSGMMYAAITAARRKKAAAEKWQAQTDGGKKAWLARPEWAAGKIKSSADAQTKIMAIMALAFCGMGGLIAFHFLPKELHNGNYKALVALIFPAIGLGLFISVVRGVLARRRFGDCYFEMAAIPGALGGSLDGLIQTGTRLRLEHGLHLKLSCIRRTLSGSGDNRSTQESILWQDEKVFKSEADLPEPEPGRSGIPIHFKIPANQPECSARGNEAVIWRLEAKAKMSGPDFSASFEVPVFKVAGAAVADADETDPTAAMQMPIEEIRRDEQSKIQITDGPGEREFYFPAARNLGAAFSLTVALLAFGGFMVMARLLFHSLFFEFAFGLVSLLVLFGCVNLWFKSSRITVNASGLTSVNRWLLFARTRRFDAGEIADFDTKIGMTSGNKAYYTLKLVTRASGQDFAARKAHYQQTGERPPLKLSISNPSGVTLASGIASKPEADWLVREMTRALGRKI